MTPEQYTDDAVCFAMGLGQLAPAVAGDVVRLVCRPSFHPEVCITLTPKEIFAVALHHNLSRASVPARMPEISERATLGADDFEDACSAFDRALAESKLPPKYVVIADGIGAAAVCVRADRSERYSSNVANVEEKLFVKHVLSLALSKAKSVHLRNRIAWCGRYASRDDREFPVVPEPALPEPRVSHLLVMGSAEERAEFHAISGAGATTRRST